MDDSTLLVTDSGPVIDIEINRASEANKLTADMLKKLTQLFTDLAALPAARVLVLRSRGDIFCGGRDGRGEDRSAMSPLQHRALMDIILNLYGAIASSPIPVVGRIQGDAIGLGAAVTAACDITLSSDKAYYSFPEIVAGIPPTLAMSAMVKKVGPKAVSYLIYSGERITAQDAVHAGLVSRVFPHHEFESSCDKFIATLAAKPRIVLQTIKKYQNNTQEMTAQAASEYAGTLLALVRSSTVRE
jgi:enoyl-CoA hydratase